MKHADALRIITWAMVAVSIAANGVTWFHMWRTRCSIKRIRMVNEQVIRDAWRGGLEEAARAVGSLAERTYGVQPDFTAILRAERVIHDLIRATEQHHSTASEARGPS